MPPISMGRKIAVGFSIRADQLRLAILKELSERGKKLLPIKYIKAQMKGKVQGFPKVVPKAADQRLRRKRIQMAKVIIKCRPTKGVQEMAAPVANPAARFLLEAG